MRKDYEDFLRQRGLALWPGDDNRRTSLIVRRCTTADEVACWVVDHRKEHATLYTSHEPQRANAEISANAALVLINVDCGLLNRQIAAQARAFEEEGGFTERLYRVRSARRRNDK